MRVPAASALTCIVALHGLSWSAAARAHHSTAVFDTTKRIELRGVVVDFKLRNPHASFVVDAQIFEDGSPRGSVQRWEIESQAPSMLRSLGIDERTFEPGDQITIFAWPHRDPRFRFAHSVALLDAFGGDYTMSRSDRLYDPSLRKAAGIEDSDAKQSGERHPAVTSASNAREIARLDGLWQQPLQGVATDGPALPLNEVGMAAWRAYDPKLSPANTCEPKNVPDSFFAPFFLFELRIDERQAVLRHEEYVTLRTLRLDGVAAPTEPSGLFGSASARVAGGSLVVESRGFPASRWGLGVEEFHGGKDIPSSPQKSLTERFSASADGRTLVYEYTLTDPVNMTQPHTGRVELTRVPDDVQMTTPPCELESASMWSRGRRDQPLRVEPAP